MKFAGNLVALASLLVFAPGLMKADTIDNYSFSVTITGSGNVTNPFAGHTYTGTFKVDEQTGDVTNFSTNLLGGTFSSADLGDVATLSGGVVTNLHFPLTITAADGNHSAGFTTGFSAFQIFALGLDPNNYFAYLSTNGFFQGGGDPVFTIVPPAATPEPSSIALLGTGLVSLAGVFHRRSSTRA